MELRVDVQKKFGSFSFAADFTIRGDTLGVFGPSGSGKSTLVKLIAGLHQPDSGVILIDGEALFDSSRRLSVPVEERRVGMVFQHPNLFPHLSVKRNLLYGYRRCLPQHRKIDLADLIDVLEIGHLLDRGVSNLSGGEKQRVSIGRTVLSNPRLLLMDEPLSALDDSLKFHIISYLKSVSRRFEIPYLFISHSLMEMRLMSDKVLVVENGRIADQMPTEQLALSRMGQSLTGYINLLELKDPRLRDELFAYSWSGGELLIAAGDGQPGSLFELSSRDIILLRGFPQAISARNLLKCTVVDVFPAGKRLGVKLDCGGDYLVAEVTLPAARDLAIEKGCELYAAVKASAFRRIM
jgi:molybdate transport system ATP-binding protein